MKEPLFTKKDIVMTVFAALLIVCVFVFGCGRSPVEHLNDQAGLEDDHILEELAEIIIEDQIGIEIDLTPGSDENRDKEM